MAVPIRQSFKSGAIVQNKTAETVTYARIGTKSADSELVPISLADVGARIGTAADLLGTRADAAKAIGVSASALQRYIKGDNEPPFTAIARLAALSGVSIAWLAGLDGTENVQNRVSQPARLDAWTLGQAVYVLDGVLSQLASHMQPQAYAETLLMLCDYLQAGGGKLQPDNVVDLVQYIKRRQNGNESG
ncbi:hypothetical protein C7S18_12350 [Ahniella affigens]|uniref:HTH cro/C1-type domain-containing protein n=1 Tax=Ahniella affigens TaxID=2021234 RepID=A0A2P1PSX3_9GAMM|nr:helix-turn-helix transcriptional regulator [Ahniella affigens]AVP97943.1 hypothetical protein C7S18_12350 [Ahniella affigens]